MKWTDKIWEGSFAIDTRFNADLFAICEILKNKNRNNGSLLNCCAFHLDITFHDLRKWFLTALQIVRIMRWDGKLRVSWYVSKEGFPDVPKPKWFKKQNMYHLFQIAFYFSKARVLIVFPRPSEMSLLLSERIIYSKLYLSSNPRKQWHEKRRKTLSARLKPYQYESDEVSLILRLIWDCFQPLIN